MTIETFNKLTPGKASEYFSTCCGSKTWVSKLLEGSPFKNEADLIEKAGTAWYGGSSERDWLEAFSHHPKIGDTKALAEKFASTQHLATDEQKNVEHADEKTIARLAEMNQQYEKKFGFIFIVSATGKTAPVMLRLLEDRMINSKEDELQVAMGEQHKITTLRMKKLLANADWSSLAPSHLTTHVLDTSVGKPAAGMTIRLFQKADASWSVITQGLTNVDGRIPDLLPLGRPLSPGIYKLLFDTGRYYDKLGTRCFYPDVAIHFSIEDQSHYHVPLLINPFGYSTYRGS